MIPLERFQELLRELFQFDCADLDFGIYRIMNYKRDVIEKFITQDLPKAIAEELDRGALADQSIAAKELTEMAQQIKETLDKDALEADGNLDDRFCDTEIGRKYLRSEDEGCRWSRARSPRSQHLQPPVRLLQPLLSGRRFHLEAPILQAPALRHPLQRRGSLPVLGQQRPVLRQDSRTLPRLHLHVARRYGALQTPGREHRAEQRQGR